ncbi:glutathione S-transferase [Aulographum hederae CBS 113979]|uniref:Glutathione S-transferase n=1 Tax=Aulographum hederae CBS 113979 TaxID=1176131 RepID=A0A6G1H6R3_9PEZI|nr:glutathione S-transferase [Aulographum hederae CBS 113979]
MAPFATLYTSRALKHAKSLKILAVANFNNLEIAVDETFDMFTTPKTPEYLAKFPMGKYPVMETADGFCLAETAAMAFFVAESGPKREQLLGVDVKQRALIQQWISLADSEVFANCLPLVLQLFGALPKDEKVRMEKETAMVRAMRRIEGHLKGVRKEGKRWFVDGEEPSLADLSVAASLFWGFMFYIDEEMRKDYPETIKWYRTLLEVEEVKKTFGEPEMVQVRPESVKL